MKKKIQVKVKPEPFRMFFRDAPEIRGQDIETIIGEVTKDEPKKNELVIEFSGLGTRCLKRDDVIFI